MPNELPRVAQEELPRTLPNGSLLGSRDGVVLQPQGVNGMQQFRPWRRRAGIDGVPLARECVYMVKYRSIKK